MFVLDSSVTISWYLPDEHSEATRALAERVIVSGAIVPSHWRLEVGNAVLLAMRRNRIAAARRTEALQHLIDLQLTIDDRTVEQAWTASLQLADVHRLSLYDACYLELAQRLHLPLASLDRDLRAAGAAMGIELLGL